MLDSKVLVLNKSFLPVHITTTRHAVCLLYRGLAKVVSDEYNLFDFNNWCNRSTVMKTDSIGMVHGSMQIPRVILLTFYNRVPRREVRFSRYNVYMRDEHTCQYCAQTFSKTDLTLDHVVPVSLGGQTHWENIVSCCVRCNVSKGGRTPDQAGVQLLKKPIKPHWSTFIRLTTKPIHFDEWKPYLSMVSVI